MKLLVRTAGKPSQSGDGEPNVNYALKHMRRLFPRTKTGRSQDRSHWARKFSHSNIIDLLATRKYKALVSFQARSPSVSSAPQKDRQELGRVLLYTFHES